MNTAIIVAAGSGTRFGSDVPKQFVEILGKPLLIHTLLRFEACDSVDEIVVVVAENEIEQFSKTVSDFKIEKVVKFVSGGESRAESVLNGLNAIDPKTASIVAVHDGARPLVTSSEIKRTIEAASATGAACLAGKVNDTVKMVKDGKIDSTIDRENLRRAFTPQCFRYELLKRAFDEANDFLNATDECSLIEGLGIPISFVEGSSRNIKVTTKNDLQIAELFLAQEYV